MAMHVRTYVDVFLHCQQIPMHWIVTADANIKYSLAESHTVCKFSRECIHVY